MRFSRILSIRIAVLLTWLAAGPARSQDCTPWSKTSDAGAGDLYGCAVSLSEGLLVVGSIGDDDRGTDAGKAYLYARTGNGWQRRGPPLTPSDGAAGDQFGYAVALHDGLAVVGAPFKQTRGSASGAAYVFGCGAAGCTEEKKLVPADRLSPFDQFGLSVAVYRSTIAVGVPGADAVDLFARGDGSWPWLQRIAPGEAAESFGFSVALRGGVLAVGAPFAGAVFVFVEKEGVWEPAGAPLRGSASDLFGYAVALGDGPGGWTAVVGAPDAPGGGAVHVFTSLTDGQRLATPSSLSGDAQLGVSVAIDPPGRTVLAGARHDGGRGAKAGTAYVFTKQAGVFVAAARLTDVLTGDALGAGDELGLGAAIADGVAVVGAFKDDDRGVDAGAVYGFLLDAQGRPACGPVIELTKSGPDSLSMKSFEYTVSLANTGSAEARDIMLFDGAPESLELERVISPRCASLPCPLGNLGPSDDPLQVGLVFSVLPTACDQATLTNTVTVRGSNFDGSESKSPAADVVCADLTVTLEGPSTSAAAVGSTVTYRATVSASGKANDVTLGFETEPEGVEFVQATPRCPAGLPCELGELEDEEVAVDLTYTVLPSACDDPVIRAQVSTATPTLEADTDDNTSKLLVTGVDCVDLAVGLEGPSAVVAGAAATYSITVGNPGTGTARGVRLDNPTSAGFRIESVSAPCASGFPCALGSLAAGAEVQVDVIYRVAADACCAGIAEVTSEAVVSGPDDIRDSFTAQVECRPDLAIDPIAVTPADVCSGEPLSYVLEVTNEGDSDVCGAELRAAVETANFSGNACECTGAEVDECEPSGGFGGSFDLPAGETIRCSFTGTLEEASEPFQITATVDPDDDSAMVSITADQVDLSLEQEVTPSVAAAGTAVTYSFTIVNPSRCTATGVTLKDSFLAAPAGFLTCSAPCDGGFPCSLSDVPPGETAIELSCTIDPELRIGGPFAALPIANDAEVAADNPDPDLLNNKSTATLVTEHDAGLRLSITDGLETAAPGDPIKYTVSLVNDGPSSLVDGVVRVLATTTAGGLDVVVLGPPPLTLSPGSEKSLETPTGSIKGPPGEIVATASVADPDGFTRTATDITFVVPPGISLGATMAGTLTVSGSFVVGGRVIYRVLLLNGGLAPQEDNSFAELKMILSEQLEFLDASTTCPEDTPVPCGMVTMPAPHVVEWNGSVGAHNKVEIFVYTRIVDAEPKDRICVQGDIYYDSDGDGVNDKIARTFIPGPDQMPVEETCFDVIGSLDIPTLGLVGWVALAVLLAAFGLACLRGLTAESRYPDHGKRPARE